MDVSEIIYIIKEMKDKYCFANSRQERGLTEAIKLLKHSEQDFVDDLK